MNFADFWTRYPKKEAKRDAEKAWKKLSAADQLAAFDALYVHLEHWAVRDRQYIPHAGTWLRGRRFEDELGPVPPKRGGGKLGPNDAGYYDLIDR